MAGKAAAAAMALSKTVLLNVELIMGPWSWMEKSGGLSRPLLFAD
jgi:hypothetical protein